MSQTITKTTRGRTLGLSSRTVIRCHDRGIPYYYDDNPPIQSLSDSSFGLECSDLKMVATIRDKLHSATRRYPSRTARIFIPRGELTKIMTLQSIRLLINSLRCCDNLSTSDKDQFASEIMNGGEERCRNPCLMLITALIGSGMEDQLINYIKDGITDCCLPLQYSREGSLKCRYSDHDHQILDRCKHNETNLLGMWTYAVTAPYFKAPQGRHIHYILDENDVLPV